MRYMVIVKSVGTSGGNCAGGAHEPEFVAAMQKYNNDLTQAGVLLALEGLHPAGEGVRRQAVGGKWKSVDGPFAETKEVIGGYWLWQVNSREEANRWLDRCPLPPDGKSLRVPSIVAAFARIVRIDASGSHCGTQKS